MKPKKTKLLRGEAMTNDDPQQRIERKAAHVATRFEAEKSNSENNVLQLIAWTIMKYVRTMTPDDQKVVLPFLAGLAGEEPPEDA
jgi:hypothetical protein